MKINEVIGIKPVKNIRQVSNKAIPDQSKHQLVQNILAKKMMTQSNIIKPSSDDLAIAGARVASELKRADYEHDKAQQQQLRLTQRQARRKQS